MAKRYEDNPKPVVDCSGDEVLTQQSDANDCDINTIVARAKAGADISRLVRGEPRFGSLIGSPDLREAMNLVVTAQNMFMQLDPFVRKRFNNNPAELLDFVADSKNRDEAIKLGLIDAPKAPVKDETLETLKSIDSSLKGGKAAGAKGASPAGEEA